MDDDAVEGTPEKSEHFDPLSRTASSPQPDSSSRGVIGGGGTSNLDRAQQLTFELKRLQDQVELLGGPALQDTMDKVGSTAPGLVWGIMDKVGSTAPGCGASWTRWAVQLLGWCGAAVQHGRDGQCRASWTRWAVQGVMDSNGHTG